MKNIFIMGDSYSTYGGYIPEGYPAYYSDDRKDAPIIHGAEKTWWKIFEKENGLNIIFNDSFSGSTICNSVRKEHTTDASFISRMDKYISQDFFAKNNIDTMIIFGGTNDSWTDAPIGELKYSDWTPEDLLCVLPAFCYLIHKAKNAVENVIVVLNTKIKTEIAENFAKACAKNDIKFLQLFEIDKENGHPTESGMIQIAKQVATCL